MEPRLDFAILLDRLHRLVLLDTGVFDEVRHDHAATLPAIFVVVASTLLAAVGGWLWWLTQGLPDSGRVLFESVLLGSLFSVALWIVWLLVAYVMLTQLFRQDAEWQQMLRTMGMASLPLSLSIGLFIPGVSFGIGLASVALFFGLTTMAIQSTTTAGPGHVLVANLAGFAIWAIVLGLLVTSTSYLAPGIFLVDSSAARLSEIAEIVEFP